MKKLRGVIVFLAASSLALGIVLLQLAWNLNSPSYLERVAARAGTNEAIAVKLPDYAASKLPEPEVAKAAFAKNVTTSNIQETLDSLYTSITYAYVGKTDVVEVNITPITLPIKANGYQIPPGTVFASDTVQVGGLAGVLRLAQKSLVPVLVFALILTSLAVLIGIKRGAAASLRNILLVSCVILGGLFLATLILPTLVSSLVSSSGLDAALRDIVLSYTNVLITDSGRYYVAWIVVLAAGALAMSIAAGLMHRAHRPGKRYKKENKKASKDAEVKPKEL